MEDTDMNWRKASYSSNGGANCVETASGNGAVMVRDTTQEGYPGRLTLYMSAAAWRRLIDSIKQAQ
jgi:Domain of unknown function (DUF397)